MMVVRTLLLPLLLLGLLYAARVSCCGYLLPGAPCDIDANDKSLQPVVQDAANCYNNQSNDAFFFRSSGVLAAQRQVVKGLKYIVDLRLSRTICKKEAAAVNLTSCDFQPAGPLRMVLRCHFLRWEIPWEHRVSFRNLTCT